MSDNESKLSYPGGGVRLCVGNQLNAGALIHLPEDKSHYLAHVMRAKVGDRLSLFNGQDGEWAAAIKAIGKRSVVLHVERQMGMQRDVPDIWLVLAPVKKTPFDYVIQKAAELGVRRILPVLTRRTIVTRINLDRLRANAVEAAEQSGRVDVPQAMEPETLDRLLDGWDARRTLLFCDEAGDAESAIKVCLAQPGGPAAILTGPEGGFTPEEREMLRAQTYVRAMTLGPRILRADTAALAALTIWQTTCGDWT